MAGIYKVNNPLFVGPICICSPYPKKGSFEKRHASFKKHPQKYEAFLLARAEGGENTKGAVTNPLGAKGQKCSSTLCTPHASPSQKSRIKGLGFRVEG